MIFVVSPRDGGHGLAADGMLRPSASVVAKEGDSRGIVVQFVQADIEFVDHVRHDVDDQVGIECVEDAFQATSDAVVVEMFEFFRPEIEQLGSEVSSPFGNSVNGFT